jgi:alanyl-tRNA synthetase
LVTPDRLRFDFSHFTRLSREEINKVEEIANTLVRENLMQKVSDNIPLKKAQSMGAMALFGEKYGETVRVVEFGKSVELCGGTHVSSTASIGIIKIISEGAIAAGIRRIEAVTGSRAFEYINEKLTVYDEIAALLKSTGSVKESVEKLIAENSSLKKTIEKYQALSASSMLKNLIEKAIKINDIRFISGKIEADSADTLRIIAFEARKTSDNIVLVVGSSINGKANIVVMVSDTLVKEKNLNAVTIIKEIAGEIDGSGGGQPFLAIAGGKKPEGITGAIERAANYIRKF